MKTFLINQRNSRDAMVLAAAHSGLLLFVGCWLAATGLLLGADPVAAEKAAAVDDPHKPPAMEVQEVPAVPAELIARLHQYQSVRGAAFAGWEPTGKGMLIRTRFANSAQLHRVYMPGGRREQITFFEEPCSGHFIKGQTDESLLLLMSSGGNENNQIYFFDRAGYETKLLTDGKSRHAAGPMTDDGKRMIVSSNLRNGRDTDLYLANPKEPNSLKMLMQVDKEFWSATDWSSDGKTLLLNRYVSANESYPGLLDLATNTKTMLDLPIKANPKASSKAAFGPMAFSPQGNHVLIATDAIGEFRQLYDYSLTNKTYSSLSADIPWDVEELEVDEAAPRVAFTVNEDGATKLFLLEQKGKKDSAYTRRELKLPLGIASGLEFSPDRKSLGFTLARPDAPADCYSLELTTGELTRWTFSEVGGLDPRKFVLPERIQFKSFDGRMIPAYYYRPKTASSNKPAPVLISIHGGPESQSQPYFSGIMQHYVGEMGIAVVVPNVRGSTGYGKTYMQLDNAELREDSVRDIGALLDWIGAREELDAKNVAVSGGSYGGYMVLASLVHYGERIKAGIDIVGIANFNTFLANTAAYRVDLRRVEYGDERLPQMKEVLERISPANHADKIRSALLVAHGKNDPRVPFSEAQQIAERVRSLGRPVWTVYADNEGHGFSKKDNADYLHAVESLFLGEVLGKGGK